MVALVVALVFLSIAIATTSIFLAKKKVVPVAMDSTGRVIPLVPLDQPYVTDSRVIGFVDECIRRSFGHDYENFRMTINDAKECYTPTGASEFEEAISPLIRDVINMNLVMSASLETTVVVRRGVRNGYFTWETQTPVTIYRRGTRETIAPVRYIVSALVIRVPLEQDVRGVLVRSIAVKPAGSP